MAKAEFVAANSGDATRVFSDLKESSPSGGPPLGQYLRGQGSTKSLQIADFLTFYSRRHFANDDKKRGGYPEVPKILEILHTGIHVGAIVAHDFTLDKTGNLGAAREPKKDGS